MNKIKFFLSAATFMIFISNVQPLYSQMKFNAGMFYCNFNGDTLSFDLKTDLNDQYFMTMGGTADFGLIKIQWDGKKPADITTVTIDMAKGFVESDTYKISVIWADFYTQLPYVIKKGRLTVTENSNNTIKGTLSITAELAGSSIIGDYLKGKKETILKNGYFEIKY